MVLVAIVTYNGLEWIDRLLQPFVLDSDGLEIVVVDNASTDGTPDAISERYPFVRVIRRRTNLGFGAANNLLIDEVLTKEYRGIYLLNQDASIEASAIRELADYADYHKEIGILSPKHLNESGEVEQGFANYLPTIEATGFTQVAFINAAHWYLPYRTLLSTGGFSPLFYHYGEDLDFTHRVLAVGLQVGYLPHVTAYHFRRIDKPSHEKELWLKQTYHLAQLVNPLLPRWKRIFRGIVAPLGESITRPELFRMVRSLYAQRKVVQLWNNRPPFDLEGLKRAVQRQEFSPVLLFVYNRPNHTKRILEQILSQPEAEQTPIYVYSDGAKSSADSANVQAVRALCRSYEGITLVEQPTNVGLARNVIQGVSTLLQQYDRVIVLEDDLYLSPYFLRWMNDALERYAESKEVAHLHAGTFYTHPHLQHNHALRYVGSWGWATWRDRWEQYWEPDGRKLLLELEARPKERKRFDYRGFMKFTRMLRRQTEGANDSWAVRWHASLLLRGKLSINSTPPLAANGGFDGSGTHSGGGGRYWTPVSPFPLYAGDDRPTSESLEALSILQHYYMRTNNKVMKGWYKLKELLGR